MRSYAFVLDEKVIGSVKASSGAEARRLWIEGGGDPLAGMLEMTLPVKNPPPSKVTCTYVLDSALRERVWRAARSAGVPVSVLVAQILQDGLDGHKVTTS